MIPDDSRLTVFLFFWIHKPKIMYAIILIYFRSIFRILFSKMLTYFVASYTLLLTVISDSAFSDYYIEFSDVYLKTIKHAAYDTNQPRREFLWGPCQISSRLLQCSKYHLISYHIHIWYWIALHFISFNLISYDININLISYNTILYYKII